MPRKGKAAELGRWLDQNQPVCIGQTELARLREFLTPISEDHLRRLLRACGRPLELVVEGVRQGSLDELEASLLRFFDAYQQADRARREVLRRLVVTAKEHARLAARNPGKQTEKQEMILWLTTWLENPPIFPDWIRIRRGRGAPPSA